MTSFWLNKHGTLLLESGYRILPLVPHEKRPGRYTGGRWTGLTDWSKHCDRDTTSNELDVWTGWPGAGIGIACGNVVAVDIDVSDAGAADAIEALAHERFGRTPLVRFGLPPKRILVYRAETPFPSLRRPPVEVLGHGSQFVAYGFHPVTRKAYSWRDDEPGLVPVAELPAVTEDAVRAFLELADQCVPAELHPVRLCGDARGPLGPRTPDELRGTRRGIELALAHLKNEDVPYDDWIRIGYALKGALGEGGRDLWRAWSATSKKGDAAATERAWRGMKLETLRSGAGTIYKLAQDRGWEPEPDVVLNGRVQELLDAEREHGHPAAELLARVAAEPVRAPSIQVLTTPRTGDILLDAIHGDIPMRPPEADPSLYDVDGLVGDIAAWITKTAPVAQPWLSLAAALTVVGVLTGRRWEGPTRLRGNLQIMAVAPSGAGKDHPRKAIAALFRDSVLAPYLGPSDIASSQGLLAGLQRHAAQLYTIDEWGHWLLEKNGPRAGQHTAAICKLITLLFTSSDSVYTGTDYADAKAKPREPLQHPTACWYCTSTGEQLWRALSLGAAEDGFLARWLLFSTERGRPLTVADVDDARASIQEAPADLVERARMVSAGLPGWDYGGNLAMRMAGNAHALVPTCGWTVEAQAADRALHQRVLDLQSAAHAASAYRAVALLARSRELALRLAMVRAVGARPMGPEVEVGDIRWAYAVVEHCQVGMLSALERHVGETDHERNVKRILEHIRKAGANGLTRRELTRKEQRTKRKDREEIVRDLVDGGSVEIRKETTGGREREVYIATEAGPHPRGIAALPSVTEVLTEDPRAGQEGEKQGLSSPYDTATSTGRGDGSSGASGVLEREEERERDSSTTSTGRVLPPGPPTPSADSHTRARAALTNVFPIGGDRG